jgi:hypothetical protein
MRIFAIAALALASVSTAHAADDAVQAHAAPVSVRTGDTLRDAKAARIGAVSRVYGDGSVQVIYGSRFVVIPADTLTTEEGKLKTSLTRQEIAKLK